MSSGVDHIREFNEAVASSDFEAMRRLVDADVVWEQNIGVGSPEEGVYRGRSSFVALLGRILEAWESLRPEPFEIRELRDGAYLVRGVLHGKHSTSATEVDTPYEQHLEIRDGLLVRGRMVSGGDARLEPANSESGGDSANAALIREFTEAFNRRDVDYMTSQLDPDVELHEWPTAPGAGSYRGREGVRSALDSWFEAWAWMQVEVVDVVEVGERVMVTLHQRAKGKGSEVEVEIDSFNVYTVRDGKVTRIELFTEREPALAAAGLTENRREDNARAGSRGG